VLSRAIALLGMCSLAPKPCVSTIYQGSTPRPSSTTQELRSPRSSGPSIPEGGFTPLACTFSFPLTISMATSSTFSIWKMKSLPLQACTAHPLARIPALPCTSTVSKTGFTASPRKRRQAYLSPRAPVFPIAGLLTLSSAKPSNFPLPGLTGVLIAAPPFRELDIPCIIKQAPPQPRLLFQSRVVQISWIFTPLDTSYFLFLLYNIRFPLFFNFWLGDERIEEKDQSLLLTPAAISACHAPITGSVADAKL
jgi:hypothetical protein